MAEDTVGNTRLHVGDIIVITVYFLFVLFVGLWSSRRNRGSAGGYFLAGRNMNWIPIGASLYASNIGSLHFVGMAGSAAASGIAVGNYELNAIFVLLLLGYVFLPVYIASGVFTMPEYLRRRFGRERISVSLAVLALLVYIFTKISADLYAGVIFIQQSLRWDMYGSLILLLGIAALFTITGGLTAVIWTDFIQTIIMLSGAFVLMIISFMAVGGFEAMVEQYPLAIANSTLVSNYTMNTTCGRPRDDFLDLMRDPVKGDIPWPGLVGVVINSIWYWCSDQVIVQRTLAAKNYDHAKAGTILCRFIKSFGLFFLIFPGMIARILYTESVACADPDVCMEVCGSRSSCANVAYPLLVINLLPAGARGLMLAVMLSALMTSLTSIFNSSSTIFAMDIWTKIRRKASELEIMIVGRVFVLFLVVVSIVWIPVLQASQGSDLYVYIQEVSSFLQPPICAIFLLGIFWPRLNEKGAFFSLIIGMVAGLVRFIIQYSYVIPECGGAPDPTPSIVKDFHYLYFSCFLFLLTVTSAIVISVLTKPIDKRCLHRLTWATRHSKEKCLDINRWHKEELESPEVDKVQEDGDLKVSDTDDVFLEGDSEAPVELTHFSHMKDLANHLMHSHGDSNTKSVNNDEENASGKKIDSVHPDDKAPVTEKSVSATPEESKDETVIKDTLPFHKKMFNWVCGIDEDSKAALSSHTVIQNDMISIKETLKWKWGTNLASIFLIGTALFYYIYFW
ncbi:hypothetical protein SNE40_001371 [Patella caerulea]|uniref:Sodium/glucose cotransporter 4 n=1 Tax=Patella caerulea TaxID=87958 RepID=A0AAN8Q2V7_PATCE